jgi:N6-L-threonylcarbamoyladenine synthase
MNEPYILAIESSCDDTSAAVIHGDIIVSNITASQEVHRNFGGVVPELASRAHQQNIIPVVETAIKKANIEKKALSAVAFTRGPGLLGSLLVGISYAKSLALGLGIPLIEVDHMQAHILCHFIQNQERTNPVPTFPFLCLTVSGGHTQLVLLTSPFSMEVIGQTIDDAAGEAFDKSAKILGLPYPGGPMVDKLASTGNPERFRFAKPQIPGLDFSFSGLKTSILYFLRDELKADPDFIETNKADLCASIQLAIVDILMNKLRLAVDSMKSRYPDITRPDVAIAGGVSANSGLRNALIREGERQGWNIFIPPISYSTDNAAMIGITAWFKYQQGLFASHDITPYARGSYQ